MADEKWRDTGKGYSSRKIKGKGRAKKAAKKGTGRLQGLGGLRDMQIQDALNKAQGIPNKRKR